jgi:hypothetical protein
MVRMEIEVNSPPPETTLLSSSNAMPLRTDRRDDGREFTTLRIGCLLFDDRRELCLIRNISGGGALVRTYSEVAVGRRVALELKQGESVGGRVRWCEGNLAGIMFDHLLDVVQLLADSSHWPRPRQPRVEVQALARIQRGGEQQVGQVIDISQGGMKIRTRPGLERNCEVVAEIAGLPGLHARIRWMRGDVVGLVFAEPLTLGTLVGWVRHQQSKSMSTSAAGVAA